MKTFEALIFDGDGVLFDSEVLYQEIERAHLSQIGLDFSIETYTERFLGRGNKDFEREISAEYYKKFGDEVDLDFWRELRLTKRQKISENLEAVEGIPQLLQKFISVPKAVASSSAFDFLNKKLEITNLKTFFGEHIYSGDFVENGKPAPDIFLYTANALNVSPDNCIVIEDSVNGIKSGKEAGMFVVGFCGGRHCNPGHARNLEASNPDNVFLTTEELDHFLSGIFIAGQR